MDSQFETAPRFVGDGVEETPWMAQGCAVVTQDVWGTFSEIVRRGYVFSAACASTALGAAFTTTPPLAIWNPPNSGRNLSFLRSSLIIITAQTTFNTVGYGITPNQASTPTGGTALTVVSAFGAGASTGVGKAFGGSTLVAAPTLISAAFTIGTTQATISPNTDRVDGMIIAPPGTVVALQGVATLGTGSGQLTLQWAEIPLTAT